MTSKVSNFKVNNFKANDLNANVFRDVKNFLE